MSRWISAVLLMVAAIARAQPPQAGTNFLQEAFGRQPLGANPLLSAEFPRVSLLFANRDSQVEGRRRRDEVTLRAPGSEARMVARLEHQGEFDFCRIRHEPGSPIPRTSSSWSGVFPWNSMSP